MQFEVNSQKERHRTDIVTLSYKKTQISEIWLVWNDFIIKTNQSDQRDLS